MIIVGLTGSIATGKSTVAEMFRELGAFLIDWDVLAREVVEPNNKTWKGILDYFGPEILLEDSTINRPKLGEIVFRNPEKLEKLNQIVHPAVIEADENKTAQIREIDPKAIIIKDIPLLIEVGYQKRVEKVVVVSASEENQIRRLMNNGFGEEEALERIRVQLPVAEKVKFADFVIHNNGSIEDTRRQVQEVFDALSRL